MIERETRQKETFYVKLRRILLQNLSQLRDFWRVYKRNKAAILGLILIFSLIFLAVFSPYITSDPYLMESKRFLPPNQDHPMGTDNLGRDILSRVIWGARTSLQVGIVSTAISLILGISIGGVAGYLGGSIDNLLMRFTDLYLSLPYFFLLLLIAVLFGANIRNVTITIGVLSWPFMARLARSEILSVKERIYIDAAKVMGAGHIRILFGHILPNSIHAVMVAASMRISSAILQEAYLSFLGVGDPNVVSWGQMLRRSTQHFVRAPWMSFFPGFFIFLALVGFNLIGDGLNDALNPRLRER
jgi:peptide/nickel transport system permease protein